MKAAIDKAGRIVIPKRLRDEVGLQPGTRVEVVVDGAGLRIEPAVEGPTFEKRNGFLVIPATGDLVTAEQVRDLRLADQK